MEEVMIVHKIRPDELSLSDSIKVLLMIYIKLELEYRDVLSKPAFNGNQVSAKERNIRIFIHELRFFITKLVLMIKSNMFKFSKLNLGFINDICTGTIVYSREAYSPRKVLPELRLSVSDMERYIPEKRKEFILAYQLSQRILTILESLVDAGEL